MLYCQQTQRNTLSNVKISLLALVLSVGAINAACAGDALDQTVVINEFLASNSDSIQDPQGQYDDWIELHNYGVDAVDIGGMYLTDDLSAPTKWRIIPFNPHLTTIPAGGYLLIWADNDVADAGLHANFKLDANGEDIALFGSDGVTLIDSVTFGDQTTDISYGRSPDAGNNWRFFASPSPAAENIAVYEGFVADVQFSHERGFYNAPLSLTLATETEDVVIYYSRDGSSPYKSTARGFVGGTVYNGPVSISSTTCLRAVAVKEGWKPSDIKTHTYIFVKDVIRQSSSGQAPGSGWPTGSVNGQTINYGMDPDIVNAPRWAGLIEAALLDIPTISLVTDLANLFDQSTGIYVNARNDGINWERRTSVELINPDGTPGFGLDAGLRIRGAFSRTGNNPKHAFRLIFRSEYGAGRLRYPLFGDEGVDEFDKIDLRTSQNNSWAFQGSSQNTLIRDVFSRDVQRDMGQPYTRSRYYHLYINGHYWGIYQTQERADADFAESYLGGDEEDYDVIKNDSSGSRALHATDGNMDAYRRLYDAAVAGFSSNEAYLAVQGLRPDGTPDPTGEKLLDPENLMDYMICTYYTGDPDAPVSCWAHFSNNVFAIYNRVNPEGFTWYRHDAEHSLGANGGVNEGRLLTDPTDRSIGQQWRHFNPAWLHVRLTANPEYLMKFADRVNMYLSNGGLLTAAPNIQRWMDRANQIDLAIIAESARWGDAQRHPPRTKTDWEGQNNYMVNTFFPARTQIVINQMRSVDMFPNAALVSFNRHGGEISPSFELLLSQGNGRVGTIYYTLDGSDPQQPDARHYTGPITLLHSAKVKARVFSGRAWSALSEAAFAVGPVMDNLRITEIMYNPSRGEGVPPSDRGQDARATEEFIELTNIGVESINLNLVSFTDGIDFTFPSIELASSERIVVVRDRNAFESRYGTNVNVVGQYQGGLNNAGEAIRLEDAIGRTILDFRYRDSWRSLTDGEGFSLTIIDATNPDRSSWNEKDSWRASAFAGGSPRQDDSDILPNPGAVVINEVLAHSHDEASDWIELYNTTGTAIDIGGWFLSDSRDRLFKYEIAGGIIIGPHEYLIFHQDLHFGNANDPGSAEPFALSENGEQLYLSSAQNGELTGYREVQDFGASATGVAFGRYYKSSADNYNFVAMDHNTPGSANAQPKVGPVVISEIMYNPDWPVGSPYTNDQYEYIELYNIDAEPVTLYRDDKGEPWKFTDGIEFVFPSELPVTIPAGEPLLVVKNPAAFSRRYPTVPHEKILGPYDGKLSNAGENVELGMPGDLDESGERHYIRVDRVTYSDGSNPNDSPGSVDLWPAEADGHGKSLTRKVLTDYGNDPDNWFASSPSGGW